jgi:hypothetical protein
LRAWVGFWAEGLGFRAWTLKFGRKGSGGYRAGVAEVERVDKDERHTSCVMCHVLFVVCSCVFGTCNVIRLHVMCVVCYVSCVMCYVLCVACHV